VDHRSTLFHKPWNLEPDPIYLLLPQALTLVPPLVPPPTPWNRLPRCLIPDPSERSIGIISRFPRHLDLCLTVVCVIKREGQAPGAQALAVDLLSLVFPCTDVL